MILALLVVALLLFVSGGRMAKQNLSEPQLEILIGDEVFGRYPLSEDRQIAIDADTLCEIHSGTVRMIRAACPDQICVHTKALTEEGGSIVCLPQRIVLRIVEAAPREGVDTIAG